MDPEKSTYLGDGAYARISEYGELVIFTSNGYAVTNSVVLGVYELRYLEEFIKAHRGEITS